MNKPTVHYIGKAEPVFEDQARLIPMDHPRAELNDTEIITSPVVHWGNGGVIETRNTLYIPVRLPTIPAQQARHGLLEYLDSLCKRDRGCLAKA
jgi:hypothetical protein